MRLIQKSLVCCLVLLLVATAAHAATVRDVTQQLMQTLDIQVKSNTEVLKCYQNWRLIEEADKPLLATAISAGLLVPQNRVLAPNSTDLTSVKWGLVQYGLRTTGVHLASGLYENGKIGYMTVKESTLCLDGTLLEGAVYTVLADGNTHAIAAWQLPDLVQPVMMRATLYVVAEEQMIVTNLEQFLQGEWKPLVQGFCPVQLTPQTVFRNNNVVLPNEQLNETHLDRTVYWFGDGYQGNFTALSVGI